MVCPKKPTNTQTLEDDTVTIRERDSMKQDRIAVDEIAEIVNGKISI